MKILTNYLMILLIGLLVSCDNPQIIETPAIESASIKLSNIPYTDQKVLDFKLTINDSELPPDENINYRFIIKSDFIIELLNNKSIIHSTEPILTTSAKEKRNGAVQTTLITKYEIIEGDFPVEQIKELVETTEAVVVELYHDKKVFKQEVISTFIDDHNQ